ncbi:MAG: IPT/TIG domain-containing protein [Bdellovibrionaceae bacterium]|nr:IPT/TIG domain-containing protein [Pseudobdellovibrionaceae bacterium]
MPILWLSPLFISFCCLLGSGCYLSGGISGLSADSANQANPNNPGSPAPQVPQDPSSITPTSPGAVFDDSTPSFAVGGLQPAAGDTLLLFSDGSCTNEIASAAIVSSSQTITSPVLPDATYHFSVRTRDSTGRTSNCVTLAGTFTLDTQNPIISSVVPTVFMAPTGGSLTVNGDHFVEGSIVSLVTVEGTVLSCANQAFVGPTTLTCSAPGMNEAVVDVKVTKPAGGSVVSTATLAYTAPLPTSPVCFGGSVSALAKDSSRLYVGGSFLTIGSCTGGGVPVDSITGIPSPASGFFPKVAGTVNTVISDGSGGFFIGGAFQSVGGQNRHNVARILSDMTVDPNIGSDSTLGGLNGDVSALAYDGNKLFLGGSFTSIGRKLNSKGAFIDLAGVVNPNQLQIFSGTSGAVYASVSDGAGGFYVGGDFIWAGGIPTGKLIHIGSNGLLDLTFLPAPNGRVYSLVLNGSTLYVGGMFTSIGGQTRNRIAALDTATGNATVWNPNANSIVYTLLLSGDGTKLYAGGDFATIGGQSRNRIAALDTSTGNATTWNPIANAYVSSLAMGATYLYAGGTFTNIGGQTRNNLAALDLISGSATTWNPNVINSSAASAVREVAVHGSTVYVGGDYTNIGGLPRNNLAAFDDFSGNITSWNPDVGGGNLAGVHTIKVSGSAIYIGGSFTSVSGSSRNNLAAVDLTSGVATGWAPDAAAVVHSLSESGTNLFAGGDFSYIGGIARNNLAAIDVTTGVLSSWNANLVNRSALYYSQVIALAAGQSNLYVSGSFTEIGGQARDRLAALDTTTGTSSPWNPGPDSFVYALALSGTTLYAGGDFANIGGQSRNGIAAIDTSTGSATVWNPNSDGQVSTIVVGPSGLYAGGWFNNIGGQTRNYLAALDLTTGQATSWNPAPNDGVNALAISSSTLFVAGDFTTIGGRSRSNAAGLDITTGNATAWSPEVGGYVSSLLASGSTVYIGGDFSTLGGKKRNNLAALDLSTGNAIDWNPNADSSIDTMALSGSTLYVGGSFTSIGGQTRNYVAAVDSLTGAATSWNPSASGGSGIKALSILGSTVFVGGYFSSIGGQSRDNLAALDLATGNAIAWNPRPDAGVLALSISGSTVFVGGQFNNFLGIGASRSRIAAIDAVTGAPTSWNPNSDGDVFSLFVGASTVYIGGSFSSIGGQQRVGSGAFDISTGNVTVWNPGSFINTFIEFGATVFVGGSFSFVGGRSAHALAALDSTTGATSWSPNVYTSVNVLLMDGSTLYIGGSFNAIGGTVRSGVAKFDTITGTLLP